MASSDWCEIFAPGPWVTLPDPATGQPDGQSPAGVPINTLERSLAVEDTELLNPPLGSGDGVISGSKDLKFIENLLLMLESSKMVSLGIFRL